MKLRVPDVATRATWNLADQVISSGTNALLSFLVAREVDQTAFGGFAVAFAVFSVFVGVGRAISTSPLAVRFPDASPEGLRDASSSAVGSAVALGVTSGLTCAAVGVMIGGPTGRAIAALGVVLPALLVQDAWRYVFFASCRPAAAAANDAVWGVAQVVAVMFVLRAEDPSVRELVLAWGGAAAIAAVVGVWQGHTWPRPQDTWRWLRAHRSLTGFLLAEFGTLQGFQQAALLVIAAVGSLEAIGALRGVQVLLGPTTILAVAALSFAVPELSRRRAVLGRRGWLRGAAAVSGVVTVLGLAWGVLFLLLPDVVGRELLGDTWPATQAILWPTIIGQVGATLPHGAAAALLAMDRAKATFSLNAVFAPLTFVGGVGGVIVGGAAGAAWGFAAAFWVMVPLWWLRLRREAANLERQFTASGTED